ncbi:MAG: hypothetical protein IJ486_00560 [Firmicutes bacterium]|nr:hypothetical protein [Bacillota bacterium]
MKREPMTRERSELISGLISMVIAEREPSVEFSQKELKAAKRSFTEDELEALREQGILGEDFETFLTVKWFVDALELEEVADEEYIRQFFKNARKLDINWFYDNLYMKEVTVPKARIGKFQLGTAIYDKGEFFQYDMPDFSTVPVVPKVGFFDGRIHFPSIYEGITPWMSICPSEIFSMEEPIRRAHGRVLVLGLGLGYYPFMISKMDSVSEIVIVERQKEVIELFNKYLLPQFSYKDKMKVVQSDAFIYMNELREEDGFAADEEGRFDFCFADIWENQVDGAKAYRKIKPHEVRLPRTEFTYWIEDSILWQLRLEEGESDDE